MNNHKHKRNILVSLAWYFTFCCLFSTACGGSTTPSGTTRTLTPTPTPHPIQPEGTVLTTYRSHSDLISAFAWSPDGTMLASGSVDQSVQVWDASSGKHIATYRGHRDTITSIAWSPDGKYIASSQDGYDFPIWNSQTGQLAFHLPVSDGVRFVSWSPDGNFIAAGSETVHIWNVQTRQMVATYQSVIYSGLAWSPDGKYLAVADDTAIRVWNPRSGSLVYTYRGQHQTINSLAWSPDSRRIVSGSQDGTAQVWDAITGLHVLIHHVSGFSVYGVRSVAWSPDGSDIASVDYESTSRNIHIWNAVTGKVVYTQEGVASLLSWSPDGSRIASDGFIVLDGQVTAGGINQVLVWQVGKTTHAVPPPPAPVTVPPITHGLGTLLARYHLNDPRQPGDVLPALAVAWSPDGKRLAASNAGGQVMIWNVATHNVLQTLSSPVPVSFTSLAWSPDGRRLAASGESASIWDVATGQLIASCKSNQLGTINAVAWSPDGKELALAGSELVIGMCNPANDQITPLYSSDFTLDLTGGYLSVSWSPDGKELAFGGSDSSLTILDVTQKRPVQSYSAATIVKAVAWSPDGRYVASGGFGSSITAIHPGDPGSSAISFTGDTGAEVTSASWSPSGRYLASATSSGLVQICDLTSRKVTLAYTGHLSTVYAVAWSPNGQWIASTDQDGNVLVWQAPA